MVADGQRVLAWDEANRLSQVTMPGNALVSFAYGPDGARAKKSSAASATLYPSASVEYATASGVWSRFPHMDVVLKGTAVLPFAMAPGVRC